MSQHNSRKIDSNQLEAHIDLEKIVLRHIAKPDQRPISATQKEYFEEAWNWQQKNNKPFILDTGCGTGHSSFYLAKTNPDKLIIAIDQSIKRLDKHVEIPQTLNNLLFVQARLEEFWLQALQLNWLPDYQYLLYPNPWPKKKHIQRRWQGHPILPILLKVCPQLELRTNWKIYADEFQQALQLFDIKSRIDTITITQPISAFEKKYQLSGHSLYRLTTE